ncbi:ribonuclease III domain-containing protein [Lophiotrema nucula]|uniref:Ribonuclease III domain-containing protein n=1 Tax=Lophiotrema nucula TaxID=690887 RepID=A0A6A5ZIS1_9PLEO|nr:ribonuclease III domain-containing protein [Lophiotrema nucula]
MDDVNSKIAQAEHILAYNFGDELLAAEAIQMAGPQAFLPVGSRFRTVNNNKRLAIFGDVALATALCKKWYKSQDNFGNIQPPLVWTRIRNDALGNDGLGRLGEQLGVGSVIVVAAGFMQRPTMNMLATTLEALVGAVYQDGGEDAVSRVVEHLGLDQHPDLMVTCKGPLPIFEQKQLRLTNMPTFRSLTWGPPG